MSEHPPSSVEDSHEGSFSDQGSFVTRAMVERALPRLVNADPGLDPRQVDFDTRLDDLEWDSLVLAELIVQLEEESNTLLDLLPTNRLETLGDFCRALQPVQQPR